MLLTAGFIWINAYERITSDMILERDTQIAKIAALRLGELLDRYTRELQNIAAENDVHLMDRAGIKKILVRNRQLIHVFDIGIAVYDSSMEMISCSGTSECIMKKQYPLISDFSLVRNTLRPLYSNIFTDKPGGTELFMLTIPVINDKGDFMGIVTGFATLRHSLLSALYNRIFEMEVSSSGFSYLVDGNGVVIHHRYSSLVGKNMSAADPVRTVISSDSSGAVRSFNRLNEGIITAYAPVPFTKWKLVTEENWAVITAPIKFYNNLMLVILFGGLFICGSIVYWGIGSTLLRPVVSLAVVSKQIAETGNYYIRVKKIRDDEMGMLYDGFNSMLEVINNRDRELYHAKNFLNNVINSMPSIIISAGKDGVVNQWNDPAVVFTGIDQSAAIGKSLWDISPVFGKFRNYHDEIVQGRKPVELFRQKLEGYEGRYFNIILFPLVADGDNGLVLRIDDITDLEEKDMELRQAQKMESIGILAGGLAHDFNNVLAGITGSLSVIKLLVNQSSPLNYDKINRFLDMMSISSDRASDMVNQLLSLVRKQEISLAPVDLNTLVNHIMNICRDTFHKSIVLNPVYSSQPAVIIADGSQIEQVLLNLCVNSMHAMTIMRRDGEPYGGILTVEISPIASGDVFFDKHPEAADVAFWKLRISDTGIGMDKQTVDRIFEPFFTTKECGSGSGLGLVMVNNIVSSHNGFIDVSSIESEGTTFSIFIPAADGNVVHIIKPEKQIIWRGRGLILIIDDEEMVRQVASEILTDCGYDVLLAADGEDGVNQFRQNHMKIDIVLLDYMMPKKSGGEVFVELRMINPEVKVILTSGFKQDERVQNLLNMGIKGFVKKPYTYETLSLKIYEIINDKNSDLFPDFNS